MASLAVARSRDRIGGRPKGLLVAAKNRAMAAEALYKDQKLSTRQIAKRLSISTSTLYEYLRHRGELKLNPNLFSIVYY